MRDPLAQPDRPTRYICVCASVRLPPRSDGDLNLCACAMYVIVHKNACLLEYSRISFVTTVRLAEARAACARARTRTSDNESRHDRISKALANV